MGIQVRRGNYADLDTSKLVPGEPFVTLDEVPTGGYFVGMTIAPNNVVRLATHDDLTDIKTDCEQARDEAVASASSAATSESNAEAWAVGQRSGTDVPSTDPTYENNSKYYAGLAEDAWDNIDDAVQFLTPTVTIDFTTGQLMYSGSQLVFWIDSATGLLNWNVVTA